MNVFIVMNFNLCDDPHYGYTEDLLSVSGSFDEAKAMLDAHILECYGKYGECKDKVFDRYGKYKCFSQIIRMQM